MSDLKMLCPACDAYSSSVGTGFRDEGACPYCGLPFDAYLALEAARSKGASDGLVERAAKAEARAATAETEVSRLRGLLQEIGWTVERAAKAND